MTRISKVNISLLLIFVTLFLCNGALKEFDTIDADGSCETALECSLNGNCVAGKCVCDSAWSGSKQCDVLVFDPSPKNSGYHNSTEASWGGNVIFSDGKYHMFVAQFANSCPLAYWGSSSTIVRAESDSPLGPFEFKEIVVNAFSHNPTIRQGFDGAFYLFMIGDGTNTEPPDCTNNNNTYTNNNNNNSSNRNSSAISVNSLKSDNEPFPTSIHVTRGETVYGPWSEIKAVMFADTSDMLCMGHTNPSPHFNPDGSVYLAFQAGPCEQETPHYWALAGIAKADAWDQPFYLTSPEPVTPHDYSKYHPVCVAGIDEDPFLWRSDRGFHLLTHGMCPSGLRQAHYKYSLDGIVWITSPRQTYHYTVKYDDDTHHTFARVERPQLYFDARDDSTGFYQNVRALYNGVCGTGENKSDFECVFDEMTGMTWTLARPLIASKLATNQQIGKN